MKIKRKKRFIASHNQKKDWNIVIGIYPKEEHIKLENSNRTFQYIQILNYGFIATTYVSTLSYLYKGELTNKKNQRINVYVINNNNIEKHTFLKDTPPSIYLFHKDMGNDIWECLFFTNNFKNWKDKVIETDDCKVYMKNIVYALIGYSSVLDL
jgi:hypothetical protein